MAIGLPRAGWLPALLLAGQVLAADSQVGVLGTPAEGSTVSGVGVISGYHCSSKNIEIFVDGQSLGPAGAGTRLLGTQSVCGRTDTGYSLLYAFNNLSNGEHVITAYADGVPFDSHTVTTFQSGGKPWLSGASRTVTVTDFPQAGLNSTLKWVESYQNFVITGISQGTTVDMSSLAGFHYQQMSSDPSGAACAALGLTSGTGFVTTSVTIVQQAMTMITVTPYESCNGSLNYVSGNATSGFDLAGTISCVSGLSGTVTAHTLRRFAVDSTPYGLDGYMTVNFTQGGGCTLYQTYYGYP